MQKCNFKIISVTLLALIASACVDTTKDRAKDSSKETTLVSNKICDMDGNNLTDVTIISGNKKIKTDSTGLFSLDVDTLIGNRCVLRIQKEGYFDRIYSKKATDTTNYPIQLIKREQSKFVTLKKFDAKEGAMIEANGATVTIPKSSLVKNDGSDYNGTVDIAVVYLSPADSPAMEPLMPGADLMAIANDGDTVSLISYGMVNVEMTDEDGNPLQLKEGCEANLKYPAPKGFSSRDTIPLWYFNEESGLWVEEGYSTKQGDNYVGSVKHFTWWNCDIKLENGASFRCRLINHTYNNRFIKIYYAGADSIIALVKGDNTIQSKIFPNRPFTVAGAQMPALKPGEFLDTFIVFNKIIFHDVNGNALSYVKFKINDVLYYSDDNGVRVFPCNENEKTSIRFQHYEPVTITTADFDSAQTCIVVCKPFKEKEEKQDKKNISTTKDGAKEPETNNSEEEWKDNTREEKYLEPYLVIPSDNDTLTGFEIAITKEKLLSAKILLRTVYVTRSSVTGEIIRTRYDYTQKHTIYSFRMSILDQQDHDDLLYSDTGEIVEEMKEQIEKTNIKLILVHNILSSRPVIDNMYIPVKNFMYIIVK
ncbi:MAG: hypothetical protein J5767_02070 [Paludibacteraceae bacterium]|nr:hypothetical protein [Paludibacteraceae bacterium]